MHSYIPSLKIGISILILIHSRTDTVGLQPEVCTPVLSPIDHHRGYESRLAPMADNLPEVFLLRAVFEEIH